MKALQLVVFTDLVLIVRRVHNNQVNQFWEKMKKRNTIKKYVRLTKSTTEEIITFIKK